MALSAFSGSIVCLSSFSNATTELDQPEMVGGDLPLVSNNLSSIVVIWSSDDHKSNAIRFLFGKAFVLGSRIF